MIRSKTLSKQIFKSKYESGQANLGETAFYFASLLNEGVQLSHGEMTKALHLVDWNCISAYESQWTVMFDTIRQLGDDDVVEWLRKP
jgi:hypothetical protein